MDKPVIDNADDILYRDGRFLVTTKLFRTPRQTYQISRIEKTEVRRTALPFVVPLVLGLGGFAWWANDYLYHSELLFLIVLCTALLIPAWFFGTLSVRSKALGEIATIDRIHKLQQVRAAIDDAIDRLDAHVEDRLSHMFRRNDGANS